MWALLTLAQIDWLDTWKEMERLYKTYPDKLKAIGEPRVPLPSFPSLTHSSGVSNFSVKFLERLLANSTVVPAVNQIELHPCVKPFDMLSDPS